VARAGRLPDQVDERLPHRGGGGRGLPVRRRHPRHGARPADGRGSHGRVTRVVLGHAHADHRGTAPDLGAPVTATSSSARTPKATAAGTTSTSPGSAGSGGGSTPRRSGAGTAGPSRSPGPSRRATSPRRASARCTSRATRPGWWRCTASATGSR
jgi:hypothetical protein